MNIDLLIKMANEIGDFFSGATGERAAQDVASHLRRYWAPRMRAQMLKYYEERQGAGLSEVAKSGVALLHASSQVPPGAAAAGSAPRGPSAGAKA